MWPIGNVGGREGWRAGGGGVGARRVGLKRVAGSRVPMLVVYWGRWADVTGEVGPWSKTAIARVEGGMIGHASPAAALENAQETRRLIVETARLELAQSGSATRAFGTQQSIPDTAIRMLDASVSEAA